MLLIAALVGTQSQQTSLQPPLIRSEVNQVLVPVVVTDRQGRHVSGLKASDFQIFEDGKPQHILTLGTDIGSVMPAPIVPPASAVPASPVYPDDPRMSYLFVVDTLHSSSGNFGHVRDALANFFEKEQSPGAQYALIALGRELKVLQDSTRDPNAVLAAVRANSFSQAILGSETSHNAAAAEQFTALMRQYCSLCSCESAVSGGGQEQGECPDAKNRVRAFLTAFGERTYFLNQEFLRKLMEIVRATATIPTSRTIVFISDGFNRYPGRELYGILSGYGPRDRTFQFGSRDTQPELDRILQLAANHDVKFYTLDSRGVYTVASVAGSGFSASSSSSPVNEQVDARTSPNLAAGVPETVTSQTMSMAREDTDVLAQLAHQTGGLFFENNNDLLRGVRQAVADGREYYVLVYAPENQTMDGNYRKIVVTVRDPRWRLTAKPGYWATRN